MSSWCICMHVICSSLLVGYKLLSIFLIISFVVSFSFFCFIYSACIHSHATYIVRRIWQKFHEYTQTLLGCIVTINTVICYFQKKFHTINSQSQWRRRRRWRINYSGYCRKISHNAETNFSASAVFVAGAEMRHTEVENCILNIFTVTRCNWHDSFWKRLRYSFCVISEWIGLFERDNIVVRTLLSCRVNSKASAIRWVALMVVFNIFDEKNELFCLKQTTLVGFSIWKLWELLLVGIEPTSSHWKYYSLIKRELSFTIKIGYVSFSIFT